MLLFLRRLFCIHFYIRLNSYTNLYRCEICGKIKGYGEEKKCDHKLTLFVSRRDKKLYTCKKCGKGF